MWRHRLELADLNDVFEIQLAANDRFQLFGRVEPTEDPEFNLSFRVVDKQEKMDTVVRNIVDAITFYNNGFRDGIWRQIK